MHLLLLAMHLLLIASSYFIGFAPGDGREVVVPLRGQRLRGRRHVACPSVRLHDPGGLCHPGRADQARGKQCRNGISGLVRTPKPTVV